MGVFSRPVGAGRRYASQTVVRRSSFKTRSSGERNQGGSCETVSCGCVLRCVEASSPHPTVTKGPRGVLRYAVTSRARDTPSCLANGLS